MEEAKDLLKIFDENVPSTLNLEQLKQDMKYPFVVVEGLDATGKSSICMLILSSGKGNIRY